MMPGCRQRPDRYFYTTTISFVTFYLLAAAISNPAYRLPGGPMPPGHLLSSYFSIKSRVVGTKNRSHPARNLQKTVICIKKFSLALVYVNKEETEHGCEVSYVFGEANESQ
jgi:hypothetical protein